MKSRLKRKRAGTRITRHTIEKRLFDGPWYADPDRPWVRSCGIAMTKKLGRNCVVIIPSKGYTVEAKSWQDMNRKLDNLHTLAKIEKRAREDVDKAMKIE